MNRNFSLPNTIDGLKHKKVSKPAFKPVPWKLKKQKKFAKCELKLPSPEEAITLPPLIIPAVITPAQLAALLKQKPFTIIAEIMSVGQMVTIHQALSFEVASHVARKFGFFAIKTCPDSNSV